MRKLLSVRVKIIVIERLKLFAKQEETTLQEMTEKILELGILEYLKR
jgi:hypothetical protein